MNHDDAVFPRFLAAARVPHWTYGRSPDADVCAESVRLEPSGIRLIARTPAGRFEVESRLIGRYNMENILAAIAVALHFGVPVPVVQAGVAAMDRVPGRFERVDLGQDFLVVVDYAHTPDALERLLQAVQDIRARVNSSRGRIITVFGCGGDRDPGKRPAMGRVAAVLSDLVVVTSDNPRTEDPAAIIAQIQQGLAQAQAARRAAAVACEAIPDRREAIVRAIEVARPGDIVVIAGKGHETYQIIGHEKRPFDDRVVAREAIENRLGSRC